MTLSLSHIPPPYACGADPARSEKLVTLTALPTFYFAKPGNRPLPLKPLTAEPAACPLPDEGTSPRVALPAGTETLLGIAAAEDWSRDGEVEAPCIAMFGP